MPRQPRERVFTLSTVESWLDANDEKDDDDERRISCFRRRVVEDVISRRVSESFQVTLRSGENGWRTRRKCNRKRRRTNVG